MYPPNKDVNGGLHSTDHSCMSNGVIMNQILKIDGPTPVGEGLEVSVVEDLNFSLKIYKDVKIRIYKPLLPLKLALFCWFGAAAAISTFLSVFFKQRGLTLAELSTIYIISPAVQFLGPTLSGIIADKLGRSKPVLVANMLLTLAITVAMLLVPRMNTTSCEAQPAYLKCHHKEFDRLIARTACDITADMIKMESCDVECPENVTQYCSGQNLICELLHGNGEFGNFSLAIHVNGTFTRKNQCFYNVGSITHKNTTYSWCNVPHKMYCTISCELNHDEACSAERSNRTVLLVINMILLMLFFTTVSNCYRFMDVTSMCLVKEHNADFGRERFFSICGVLVFAPVSGFLVNITTPEGEEENYSSAFYLFIAMIFVTLAVIYKLKVQLKPPGKRMLKNSFNLIKNPDVVAFIFVLFILGTTWGFTKNFTIWYLEEMNASSFLLGLVPAVSSLYGLPFLMTSNWWVKKIGPTQIFMLAFLGYIISGLGYSYLYDPWLALLLEATSVLTYHLLWVAVILHSHNIAPEGLTATVISTAGALHYSIGKCSGSLTGGLIMDSFGGRTAYRFTAIICLISSVFYALYLFIRRTCFAKKQAQEHKENTNNAEEDVEELEEIYRIQNET